ncbi:MAG: hypothetical protein AVDCRST_MAG87-1545 [uncultured Thermomicrobiales bacterium]|uniref:Uncharacterized protein n=1 Tax=uncultured Thermomicrobiales bacterium TaxID=1645740 RepID=A0A6J4UUU9_9BACT|nr:MAG: hypothetical protein AVDCRST_MAG87-1545 [uncultured Thermomicrobiales bacterium]
MSSIHNRSIGESAGAVPFTDAADMSQKLAVQCVGNGIVPRVLSFYRIRAGPGDSSVFRHCRQAWTGNDLRSMPFSGRMMSNDVRR